MDNEVRRPVVLKLDPINDQYLKHFAKDRQEPVGVVVSRMVNLLLEGMRAQHE